MVRALSEAGYEVHAPTHAELDITDTYSVRAYFQSFDRLDVLVNNAVAPVGNSDFADMYASVVTAAYETTLAARAALATTGAASVVNVSSIYGVVSPDKRISNSPFHYGPAKAALLQLTRHMAAELGPENIRVNALVPGPFPRTEHTHLIPNTMLRRLGRPEEIAGPLLFLAGDASSFMTGASLVVDGGWTAW